MNSKILQVRTKAIEVLQRFDVLEAVGMAGSRALEIADQYSDLDLAAFAVTAPPELDRRRQAYESVTGIELGPLGHSVAPEFENPPFSVGFVVDWLKIDGVQCDVLWLSQQGIDKLFAALADDEEHPETVAVLASIVKPVFDPHGFIEQLMSCCPEYTEERARRKTRKVFGYAHFFICDWGVLDKAAFRNDILAYQNAETEMVKQLVAGLYAVNRAWRHDQRHLRFWSKEFAILPSGFLDRLESMILRNGEHSDLESCTRELKMLFRDLAVAANSRYADWRLPRKWLDE